MSPIERHIRTVTIMERVEQLIGELIVLGEGNHTEAAACLTRAAEILLGGPTERTTLETALRLSIASEQDKRIVKFPGA